MNQLKNVWSSCERELRKTASKVLPGCTFFFSLSEECLKPHCKRCRTSREDEWLRPIQSGGWLRPGWTLVNLLLLSTSPSGNQSEPSAVSGGFTQCARELRACVNGLTMVHIHLLCVGIHQHLVQYLLPNQNKGFNRVSALKATILVRTYQIKALIINKGYIKPANNETMRDHENVTKN